MVSNDCKINQGKVMDRFSHLQERAPLATGAKLKNRSGVPREMSDLSGEKDHSRNVAGLWKLEGPSPRRWAKKKRGGSYNKFKTIIH